MRALAALMAWMASGLALTACQREAEPPPPRVKQIFHLNPYEKDFGYSQAVLVDKTLYISGSVAADANGRLVAPGFWVPHWIVRAVLRRDLPKMLRALRTRAEFVQKQPAE